LARKKKVRRNLMQKFILRVWGFIFDHKVSPLRHIPDVNVRHMVLQLLGWMWAISFAVAIGSYTVLAVSLIGHAVLIAAMAITAATYATATLRPKVFLSGACRRSDGDPL
jgi:hypothetical protein